MTTSVKARVQLTLDGQTYEPGEWITLPDDQRPRAQELMAYGLVDEAPAAPVKVSRRRKAS
ncbi:hypothetical protein E6R60_26850 [Streptomyces sp. A0642]|uniref:hypothetical protein n=1 Tax=Streptomyces sp. A0642 TaxID=2563100 RepID=UPI0010A28A58|nr:hypothetical protein [Streptomyces sp. A0642]THA72550.1 hypothetical protein E6R60_26850 [Streptomyces sp. A0642]